jgi:cell division protease FtsH
MHTTTRQLVIFVALLIAFAALLSTRDLGGGVEKVDMKTLVSQIQNGEVKHISIEENTLNIELQNGKKERALKETSVESVPTLLKSYGVSQEKLQAVAIEVHEQSAIVAFLSTVGPFLIPFLLVAGFLVFMMRQVQGANTRALSFGQSGAREYTKNQKDKVTFKDVAGVKEAKEELSEIVEFLKNPKKFINLGAKIPKGVLLMGHPGTGKTLLARAVAGEANVPFFSISGSEFVEMFVGVGAARVRDLFARAKKNAPCIIFVDEIDAVGRQRGTGLGGSHDEREQTLNQILVEMDGFDANSGIIIMAATNRADVLDPALLRPGRFDRRVTLDLPDINDREMILKTHGRGKPIAADVKLRVIAERTPGFSGADLMNIMNEAAILAARRNKKQIGMEELIPSVEKVMLGPERKTAVIHDEEKLLTAYHEGGHAIVAHELPYADNVHKISIIPRGRAAGYTMKLPEDDRRMRQKQQFLDDIAVSLGGYVAEKEVFGDITTGASNDLQNATHLAKAVVTQYGMSERLGPRTFGSREEMVFLGREISEQRDYSESVAQIIDEEVSKIIANGLNTAQEIIRAHRATLDRVAQTLIVKENLEREEFETLVGHKHASRPAMVPRTSAA